MLLTNMARNMVSSTFTIIALEPDAIPASTHRVMHPNVTKCPQHYAKLKTNVSITPPTVYLLPPQCHFEVLSIKVKTRLRLGVLTIVKRIN